MHTSVKFQRLAISLAAVMLVTTFPTAASAQALFDKLAEKAAQKLAPAQPKPGEFSADDARHSAPAPSPRAARCVRWPVSRTS
ncbi:hypothetical protein AACH10_12980 [Ideonella sp. DXS22W]|uniref:Uncharacterized protein n=1 Tax=Pseudaquabacterium inlustre TaxID=2984192 RepID=A0ABU9CH29_9BURK